MEIWVYKMKILKLRVKEWDKLKKKGRKAELIHNEFEFEIIFQGYVNTIFPKEVKRYLCNLEEKNSQILKQEEEEWRMKIIAILIKVGYGNTIFSTNSQNIEEITTLFGRLRTRRG